MWVVACKIDLQFLYKQAKVALDSLALVYRTDWWIIIICQWWLTLNFYMRVWIAYLSNEWPVSPHFTTFHHISPHFTPFQSFYPISPLSPHFTTFHPISPLWGEWGERGEWGEMGWMGWKGWNGVKRAIRWQKLWHWSNSITNLRVCIVVPTEGDHHHTFSYVVLNVLLPYSTCPW